MVKEIIKWFKKRAEIKRRFLRLQLECRYGSINSRKQALEDLERVLVRCEMEKRE